MSSGDLLKRLLLSHKRGNNEEFTTIMLELIAEEKRKNHNVLAQDLLQILENNPSRQVSSVRRFDFEQLPQDKERGSTLLEIKSPQKMLNDIILSEDLKEQVDSILYEFKISQILESYNLPIKSKLLFAGPPGCGKTLCAEVIASELGLPLLYTRFDAVISSYLGETAANLRKVFEFASKGTFVVFFDEFDAIGKSRDDLEDHGELKRVVNTFLQLMDSFVSESIFIAATNHEKLLDRALWRRFDDILMFEKPTQDEILLLLQLKLRSFRHEGLDIGAYIKQMQGWSHSDVERVCIEAMKLSVIHESDIITENLFSLAIDRQKRRIEVINKTIAE